MVSIVNRLPQIRNRLHLFMKQLLVLTETQKRQNERHRRNRAKRLKARKTEMIDSPQLESCLKFFHISPVGSRIVSSFLQLLETQQNNTSSSSFSFTEKNGFRVKSVQSKSVQYELKFA